MATGHRDEAAAETSGQTGVETGWLEREGLRYQYRVMRHSAPEFPPTLFVSGAFQTMDSWARFARAFQPHTTVLLVDPPGMGQSDLLPAHFGVDFLAECLLHLMDGLGYERINVVAASYGTPAAFRLAQLHPDRLERVVLAGTMKRIPDHIQGKVRESIETALRGDLETWGDQVVEGLLCRDLSLPVERRTLSERVLRGGLARMSDHELQQYAENSTRLIEHEPLDVGLRIRGPEVLAFTGEHDCFTIPADCREVARTFERGWFTTIDRADHLFHIEQFDVVVELLLRFARGTLGEHAPGCAPLERWDDGVA